jgi:hypothetical protein
MRFQFEKSVFLRTLFFFSLIVGAVWVFTTTRADTPVQQARSEQDIARIAKDIDREVDSVLMRFKIDKKSIRKKVLKIPETELERTERRVAIPRELDPIAINREINLMAQKYNARAAGSENLKENTTTIHIKLERYVVETIILKTVTDKNFVGGKRAKK